MKPQTQKLLGYLFGIMGAFVGFWLSICAFEIHAQKIRAADPTRFICGNDAFPVRLLGLIVGGLGGIVFGKVVGHLLNRSKRNP